MNNEIQIKVKDDDLKGSYANVMQVMHSKEEFVLDFFNVFPPAGILASRLVISPGHLKRIVKALQTNIDQFEKANGKIDMASEPENKIGFHANQ